MTLWAAGVLGFIYLPILVLVIFSFNNSRFTGTWQGFTWDWYRVLLTGQGAAFPETVGFGRYGLLPALGNSLIVATVTTVVATVLGTALALGLDRVKWPGRVSVEALVLLPLVIPEIAQGVSLLVFFHGAFRLWRAWTGQELTLGLPTVTIGHITFAISFVTLVVRARLAELNPRWEEAAMDLGANRWQTLRYITLPWLTPALLSGALLVFTLSLDDFVVTFFTAGTGATTLPVFVYGMIKFSVTPAINAISTLMLLASSVLVLLAWSLQRQPEVRQV
ncbi:MAG: ABC transporter permease [Gloeomargarita sp. SKYG116]|nr:ABC transporter permease [Gloeomargarita sp. SKYG116]MDW8400476.1 ABC transporter permease [Gloeomargarita sp. SKYGB_i_bin116]